MQIIVIAALILVVFLIARNALKDAGPDIRSKSKKAAFYAVLTILAVLALSGRLAWLLAAIGAIIAALIRLAPLVAQLSPIFARLWMGKDVPGSNHDSGSDNRKSANQRMSREEALQVLGLNADADRNSIIEAHRRLMQKLHPDRGGSDFLAAQINQARKLLLDE